ncbi:MAG: MerR family transcriptional regulator [Bacteroidota bacterium]
MIPQKYSISDLEKLTGIKAPTIRIWEKRYRIITPERTETNIRFYSEHQLQRLLTISLLNRHGWKISLIADMTDEQIQSEVSKISDSPGGDECFLPDLIQAFSDLDEDRFERILNSSILKLGFEQAFNHVVFPLLEKVNLMWQIGKINACQERFTHNLIRQKLVVASDGLAGQTTGTGSHYLLYLPAGNYDEILLLYANYLLRKRGHQIIYLGPSIPLDHLRSFSDQDQIDHVVVSINIPFTDKELQLYTDQLNQIFPTSEILVICMLMNNIPDLNKKIAVINSYSVLTDMM